MMQILVDPKGGARCIYGEAIELARLGEVAIRRVSSVEPDAHGAWWADVSAVGGPNLGPFPSRGLALEAERVWLLAHWLVPPDREHYERRLR